MKAFNTFAGNSPISSSYYSPKTNSPKFIFPTNTDSRGPKIQQVKANLQKELFEKLPSIEITKGQQQQLAQQLEQQANDSRISLLLSQVSIPAPQRPQFDAKRLFNLQSKITQNILELREQKISLMQELSKTIDIKNLHEHYLNQKAKEKDQRQTTYGSRLQKSKSPKAKSAQQEFVPTHISAQILRKNEELHLRLKELQIKQEIFGPSLKSKQSQAQNAQTMDEVMRFKELNTKLKAEIAQKLKVNPNVTSNSDSRFVTFLPQDRQKHLNSRNVKAELQELKQKYAKLLAQSKEPVFKLTQEQNAYIEELRRQNQQLQRQAEEILRKKEVSRVHQLRQRLQRNQHEKSIFLSELQKFKNTMRSLKQQNDMLKKQLGR